MRDHPTAPTSVPDASAAVSTPPGPDAPGALIERSPLRVRPPYRVPDDTFEHLHATDTDAWRRARRLDRLTAMHEALDGLPVTDYEARILEHLSGSDTGEVAVIAALLHRCRAAGPLRRWSASGPA